MKPQNAVPALVLAIALAVLSVLSCAAGDGDATASFFGIALCLTELSEAVGRIHHNIMLQEVKGHA